MTKKITPPAFMQKKLNTKTKSFVKNNMTAFLQKVKDNHDGKYPEPMQLLG